MFKQIKHHRVGSLAAAMCAVGLAVAPAASATTISHYSAEVSASSAGANGVWYPSGIGLTSQDQVTLSASGTASAAPGWSSGPAGMPGTTCGSYASASNPCPMNSAPVGALIARVGGSTFVVGTGTTFRWLSGELDYAFNDPERYFADNSGAYSVAEMVIAPAQGGGCQSVYC